MNNALVVNFIAPPGSGKSTIAAEVFAKLKWMSIDCELVTEFAKELVWEERNETFKDEIYIFAKQFHRLFRIKNKVKVIITDRPIILSAFYNIKYGNGQFETLNDLVLEQHNKFNNINFFLNRKKQYNSNGRNQTEEESNVISIEIKEMLNQYKIPFLTIDAVEDNIDLIIEIIKDNIEFINCDNIKGNNYMKNLLDKYGRNKR